MSTNNALTDHAYDGIQEYDNPLPGWWKWFFVITVVFSPFYWMYFHFGAPDRTMHDMLKADEARMAQKQYGTLGPLEQNRANLVRFMKDPSWVSYGQSIYKTNCQSCHGATGGGLVGPNLCDGKWKNVRHIEDIIKIVNNGANNNAMPAWKQRFSEPRDVIMVSAYVASLLGSNPAGAKPPEGNIELASWDADIAELPADALKPAEMKMDNQPESPKTKP